MLALSLTTGYAIKALSCLESGDRAPHHISDIARRAGVPRPYLAKIINSLSRARLVTTKRGYRGGISLARAAGDISLLEVVEAVEGREWMGDCLLGMDACSILKSCPTREFWARVRREITEELRKTTLASVLAARRSKSDRVLMPDRRGTEKLLSKMLLCYALSTMVGVAATTADRLKVEDFSAADKCGACHEEIYQQWRTSFHAQSATDPVFWQVLRQAVRDRGSAVLGKCLTCHAPVAAVGKEVQLYAPVSLPLDLSPMAKEGVTCDFCHTISGKHHIKNNVSVGAYRYPRRGTTAIKYGRHTDALTSEHVTESSSFLTNPEFCGICHKFTHPFGGKDLQDTYAEWKNGPYAKMGMRCQDCHMPVYSGRGAEDGPVRTDLHAHVFPGGHSEMLKRVATVTLWAQVKPDAGKSRVKITALVGNTGSGHFMPTGVPGIREMWLEIAVRTLTGAEVFTAQEQYGVELLGADGKPTMPWNAVRLGKDTRIAPQKSRKTASELTLPQQAFEPLEVRGSVYYRLISEQAAKAAQIDASPAIEIAVNRIRVFSDGRVEKIGASDR